MQTDIKAKGLDFLYAQVSKGNIPQIKKGMLEDLLAFIEGIKAEEQAQQMAKRMLAQEQAVKEAGNE
jgi:hypothetical protein